jgi:thioredoxin reductase
VAFHSDNGYAVTIDPRGRTSDRRVFAAGHCCGAGDVDQAWRQGLRAGLACALSLDEDKEVAARLEALIAADAPPR